VGNNIFEETQDLLTDVENLFSSAERFETTVDNLFPSTSFASSLFFGFNMSADVVWLTGVLVLGVIYAGVHFAFDRRHRDSWDAYLARERDRLDRIGRILDAVDLEEIRLNINNVETKERLQKLRILVENYEKDTRTLCSYLGPDYERALGFKISPETMTPEMSIGTSTESDNASDDQISSKEETKKQLAFAQLLTQKQKEKYQALMALLPVPSNVDNDYENTVTAQPKNPTLINIQKKLTALEEKLNTKDMDFINGYGFNAALAYALAYWLVIYFTTMVVPIAVLATPLSWALSAIAFPAIYLIYKEFVSYKTRILEKGIDTITDKEERDKEKQKRSTQLDFRFAWLFIGLIVGVSLGFFLPTIGFSILASVGIGAAAFTGILGFSVVMGFLIDNRVERVREEIANSKVEQTPYERKKWAALRRRELDEIALIAYELELQSKLAEQRKLAALIEADTQISATAKNTVPMLTANTQEKDVPSTETKKTDEDLLNRKTTLAEKSRLVLSLILSFLAGYAFGNMLGFVFGDLLSHFSSVFAPGPFVWATTAIFSTILAGLFVKRAYYTEKVHQTKLDMLAIHGSFVEKQDELSQTEKEIADIKKALKKLATEKQHLISSLELTKYPIIANLKKLQPDFDFVHPVQQEGLSKRKVLFGIRAVFQVLTSVATALLFTRMLLLAGFAKFIPALSSGSLLILGASIGPLGFVVLGLALAVLIVKAANDIYLSAQREKEAEAIERIDFDISCKKAEKGYLTEQKVLMEEAKTTLEKLVVPEKSDSHEVLVHAPGASPQDKDQSNPAETLDTKLKEG
jgi:MFS family permease